MDKGVTDKGVVDKGVVDKGVVDKEAMDKHESEIITSDHPLSEAQRLTLASLLDVIIPSGDGGRMPSAAELDLGAYLRDQAPEFVPMIVQGLNTLDELCAGRSTQPFTSLAKLERQSLAEELSKTEPKLFAALHRHTLACYYQDDRVLVGLGLEPGPPFPRGNTIEPGDLSLLDPVRQRPKLYRE